MWDAMKSSTSAPVKAPRSPPQSCFLIDYRERVAVDNIVDRSNRVGRELEGECRNRDASDRLGADNFDDCMRRGRFRVGVGGFIEGLWIAIANFRGNQGNRF